MSKDQSHKFYFDHPEIWEKIRGEKVAKEISFIDFFLRQIHAKNILDVGCGTGLHCYRLSRLGYQTTGVDLNQNMVNYAQANYKNCKFMVGDMRDLTRINFSSSFEGIICLCTTFAYNTTTREIIVTLRNFNSLLNKGGLVILELFNPISFLEKNEFKGSFFLEDQGIYQRLGFLQEVRHTVNERKQNMIEVRKTYKLIPNKKLLKTDRTEYRLIFPQELKFYLTITGFRNIRFFGRYDLNYKRLDRTKLIAVCKKSGAGIF